MRPMRRLAAVALVGAVLTGCSAGKVSGNVLEKTVADRLDQQTGQRPDKVDCPHDLDARAGAKTRCTLTASDGSKIGATVMTTKVEGKHVKFHIQVDKQPMK